MDSHQHELLELRKEFNKFDKKDISAIRKWFAEHTYLTTADHAQVAGKSRWYIRNLRRTAGLLKPLPTHLPVSTARRKPPIGIEIPADWDSKVWLEKAIQICKSVPLARAIGISRATLIKKLRKYQIPYKSERKLSDNPHCTKAWVYKHYVDKQLSQTKCAELAGISKENFANWLVRFEIPVRRTLTKALTLTAPLWIYKLVEQLKALPTIRSVRHREDHVHIRFMHYAWESYYYNRTGKRLAFSYNIKRSDARLEYIPTVTYQYESELDGINHYPHHIQINTNEWKKASFMERRMALHIFGGRIFDNKYQQLEYPMAVIEKEYADIGKVDLKKFVRKVGFTAYNRFTGLEYSPGKRIVEHFFDFSELWEDILNSPRYITHVLNQLANSLMPFNTHNMLTALLGGLYALQNKTIPSIPTPLIYAAILSKLGVKGPVLDLHTGFGERAIACAILGLPYVYVPNRSFQYALDRGFADFLHLQHRPHDGSKVALLLCDNGLRELPNLEHVAELSKCASHMLLFVPRAKRMSVLSQLPPKSVIPIKARFYRKTEDYLFLY